MHTNVRSRLKDRLGYRLSRAARILQIRLEVELAPEGLTRLMWLVLSGIGDEDIATPSAMAEAIGITRPATSRLLARMEAMGLVVRGGGADDGRSVKLALTPAGLATLRRLRPKVEAVRAHFARKLPELELTALIVALDRLTAGEDGDLTNL